MKKKFYQNYVVASKEEAFVILKSYIKGFCGENPKDGYMDEHICNVFTREDTFGKDKLDDSCCFLVTEDLFVNHLCKWIEFKNLQEVANFEKVEVLLSEDGEKNIVNLLHEKFVGLSNMDSLCKKDYESFGDTVSWYKDEVLFQKFWDLEK